MAPAPSNVVVIIGVGDIGLAIARRIAQGRQLLIASRQTTTLASAAESLQNAGHTVSTQQVDIADYKSVESLALAAQALGKIDNVILTSGVSPKTASTQDLYAVDLLGTVNVIDAFLPVVSHGSSVVCLSSMAAHMLPISPALTQHLATAPRDQILDNPELQAFDGTEYAYSAAKKGNLLRVQAACKAYGLKGARLNSVSPGLIASKMGDKELEGAEHVKQLYENGALGRRGTVEEIASAVEFLAGPGSSYGELVLAPQIRFWCALLTCSLVTGTDILVDGGTTPALLFPQGGPSGPHFIADKIANVQEEVSGLSTN